MKISFVGLALVSALAYLSPAGHAQAVTFVPPNDTMGAVFTTNYNDGYAGGRGINFTTTSNVTINSVGLYENLTGIALNYEVGQIPALGGSGRDNPTVLASGSENVTTNGLQFIDFAVPNLMLTSGNNYYIYFQFDGNGNQNFFYNNGNISFTQDVFTNIDGFAVGAGGQDNFVLPAVRLNEVTASTPEPGSIALLVGLTTTGAGFLARRSRERSASRRKHSR